MSQNNHDGSSRAHHHGRRPGCGVGGGACYDGSSYWPFVLSIDVLTDGSEYTGDAATLFLSIYKKQSSNTATTGEQKISSSHDDDDDNDQDRLQLDDTSLLLARYAIAGCGGDLLSRTAADQRFKLGQVRAVFCAKNTMMELASLPGLLYALQTAGAAELSIVSAADAERAESLVELMHGNQRYPRVRVCQVPPATEKVGLSLTWWQVYTDDHVIVHASHVKGTRTASACVVYLYTLTSLLKTQPVTCGGNSLLILPESMSQDDRRGLIDFFSRHDNKPFPIVSRPGHSESTAATLFAAIVVQAQEDISPFPSATLPDNWYMFTRRMMKHQHCDVDPNLLVRAQRQTCSWRSHCRDTELLRYFPFKQNEVALELGDTTTTTTTTSTNINDSGKTKWIWTGCSIVFDYADGNLTAGGSTRMQLRSVDRIRQQKHTRGSVKPKESEKSECRSSWPDKLSTFLQFSAKSTVEHSSAPCIQDEAEIDLDDLDSEVEEQNFDSVDAAKDCERNEVSLLVLGTGCASPSPYRGASGYALILPPKESKNEDFAVALEAGEGFCTQWNRHSGGRSFSTIRLIWISHAHWDHYGGLVNLLCRIKEDNDHGARANEQGEGPSKKRARNNESGISLVVAPSKIIEYLKLVLDEPGTCFRGILPDNSLQLERAFTSFNINLLSDSRSFVFWENVRVVHSCAHSYGCVFGVRRRAEGPPFLFCFSGDTRPSWKFVQVCREIAARHGCRIDFALHEATFDDAEIEMSRRKKHSTVQEALQVGRDIDAGRLLLTHFSQRYDSVPAIESESERYEGRMQVGFALDGMLIPLFSL